MSRDYVQYGSSGMEKTNLDVQVHQVNVVYNTGKQTHVHAVVVLLAQTSWLPVLLSSHACQVE